MDEPVNRLSCGSTDACCHVPYAHRHCAHCQQAIALAPPVGTRQPSWQTHTGNPISVVGDSVGGFGSYQGGGLTVNLTNGLSAPPTLPTHACETP